MWSMKNVSPRQNVPAVAPYPKASEEMLSMRTTSDCGGLPHEQLIPCRLLDFAVVGNYSEIH